MSAIKWAGLALCAALAGPAAAQGGDALLDGLRASQDPQRQLAIIDQLGRMTPPPPQAPAALLAVVRDPGADWSVRGEALAALRRMDAPDEVVAQAVAAAAATTGEHAGFLRGEATELQRWRDARATSRGAPAQSPEDGERRARLVLKTRGVALSMSGLSDAVGDGQSGLVAVLLTAGLKVDGDAAAQASMAVVNGLASACERDPVPFLGVGQSLSVLHAAGMPMDLPDDRGNTLLMSAAQFCPAPIAARLLQLGVRPAPVNKQDWTPLQMALVSGKWDVAAVLVEAGARITPAQADQIFMQKPQEPAQRDLLARATKPE